MVSDTVSGLLRVAILGPLVPGADSSWPPEAMPISLLDCWLRRVMIRDHTLPEVKVSGVRVSILVPTSRLVKGLGVLGR